jgi:hypothetical protein
VSTSSLFSRLFWYRERQGHAPYENMLSELLVALLERLPRIQMSDFVVNIFLPNSAVDQWRQSSPAWKRIEWLTEVSMTHGRADIVLVADGIPVLVIENKVGSGLRTHRRPRAQRTEDQAAALNDEIEREFARSEGEVEEVRTQLHTYAEWLASKCNDPATHGWPGALVLLTHSCPQPADFSMGRSGAYAVAWRRTCQWNEVAAWLLRVSESGHTKRDFGDGDGDQRPGWIVLAREMADFLKERNMAEDRMVKSDLEWVAQRMAEGEPGFFERVASTLTTVVRKVASDVPILQWDKFDGAFDEDSRALWGWGYLKREHAHGRYQFLALGICYPTADSDWCRAIPPLVAWPHMVVVLGYDPRGEFAPWTEKLRSLLPANWRTVEGSSWLHTFVARPVYDFPSEPDDMFRELAIWGTEQVKKVEPLIRAMAKAADPAKLSDA